jgi:hypothetical protein
VGAHLIGAANLYITSITRGLQGHSSAPPDRPAPRPLPTVSRAERQPQARAAGERIIASRKNVGNDLLDRFSTTWDQLHGLAAPLSPHAWLTPCSHPRGRVPASSLINLGGFALAIHGWDIRSALEPSALCSADALGALFAFFVAECPRWFLLPDATFATPLRYRVACTGALSRQWDMVGEGDTAHIGPAVEATPAPGTFGCDGEPFALVMGGRMGFEATLGDKRIIPTGDMVQAQAFTKWFPGV